MAIYLRVIKACGWSELNHTQKWRMITGTDRGAGCGIFKEVPLVIACDEVVYLIDISVGFVDPGDVFVDRFFEEGGNC